MDRILTLIPGLVARLSECATRMAIKRRGANYDVQVVDYFVPCNDLLVAEQLWERSVYDRSSLGGPRRELALWFVETQAN